MCALHIAGTGNGVSAAIVQHRPRRIYLGYDRAN
jgi:hypothetical protein